MVRLNTILEGIVEACNQSDLLDDQLTYATVVLDSGGAHSDVSPPLIELSVDTIERVFDRNTEKVGETTNDSGDVDGFIYAQWFDAIVTAEIFTVSKTSFNHRDLEVDFRDTLYKYDKHGLDYPLPHPDDPSNDVINDVTKLSMRDIQPNQDFNFQPSVRTRSMRIAVEFVHEVTTKDLGITYDRLEEVNWEYDQIGDEEVDLSGTVTS